MMTKVLWEVLKAILNNPFQHIGLPFLFSCLALKVPKISLPIPFSQKPTCCLPLGATTESLAWVRA